MHPTVPMSPKMDNLTMLIQSLEIRSTPDKGGFGVYARAPIKKNTIVAYIAGKIISFNEALKLPVKKQRCVVQIDEDAFITPMDYEDPFFLINHSCDPNLGFLGEVTMQAMRDIEPNEEVCYDYAMCDGVVFNEFTNDNIVKCMCGSSRCRGEMTETDWNLPELRVRYKDYYAPFLRRRFVEIRTDAVVGNF